MLDRIAKAIELAQGNAPYYVFPQFKNKYMVYKILEPGFVDQAMAPKMLNLEEAEDLCEELNNQYIARKAVEALAPADADQQNKYFELAMVEGYNKVTACFPNAVWERAISAILAE